MDIYSGEENVADIFNLQLISVDIVFRSHKTHRGWEYFVRKQRRKWHNQRTEARPKADQTIQQNDVMHNNASEICETANRMLTTPARISIIENYMKQHIQIPYTFGHTVLTDRTDSTIWFFCPSCWWWICACQTKFCRPEQSIVLCSEYVILNRPNGLTSRKVYRSFFLYVPRVLKPWSIAQK